MTAYLVVYGKDPSDRLAAYSFPDRAAAQRGSLTSLVPKVPPEGRAGGCSFVIAGAEDIGFSLGLIVAIHNSLSPKNHHINRFESRSIGQQRLFDLLTTVAKPAVETEMVRRSDRFIISIWRGGPKIYDTKEAKTLDEAREVAVKSSQDRLVRIYAVYGNRQIHVEDYNPKEKKMPRGVRNDGAQRSTRGSLQIGEFKPVREGSSLHAILKAAADGDKTVEEIAVTAGLRKDQASHRLRHVLASKHGIGHSKHPESGVIKLELPAGKTLSDAVKTSEAAA